MTKKEKEEKVITIAKSMYLSVDHNFEHRYSLEEILSTVRFLDGVRISMKTLLKWKTKFEWSKEWKREIAEKIKSDKIGF